MMKNRTRTLEKYTCWKLYYVPGKDEIQWLALRYILVNLLEFFFKKEMNIW
jgi:hypothetical protein